MNYFRYVVVQSWRPDHTVDRIRVPEDIYNKARENLILEVTTKPGQLGFEWVVSKKITGVENRIR